MNQRIGVQHFQRRAQFFDRGWQRPGHHAPRLHAEHGPQAFSAGKHAVTHGLVDRVRMLRLQRNEPVKRGVGQLLSLFESFLEHEAVSITRRAELRGSLSARATSLQEIRAKQK